MPFVSPVTVSGEALPVAEKGPGVQVAVYDEMARPPLLLGGEKVRVAEPLPTRTFTSCGAPGAVPAIVTDCDVGVAALYCVLPKPSLAVTRHVPALWVTSTAEVAVVERIEHAGELVENESASPALELAVTVKVPPTEYVGEGAAPKVMTCVSPAICQIFVAEPEAAAQDPAVPQQRTGGPTDSGPQAGKASGRPRPRHAGASLCQRAARQ